MKGIILRIFCICLGLCLLMSCVSIKMRIEKEAWEEAVKQTENLKGEKKKEACLLIADSYIAQQDKNKTGYLDWVINTYMTYLKDDSEKLAQKIIFISDKYYATSFHSEKYLELYTSIAKRDQALLNLAQRNENNENYARAFQYYNEYYSLTSKKEILRKIGDLLLYNKGEFNWFNIFSGFNESYGINENNEILIVRSPVENPKLYRVYTAIFNNNNFLQQPNIEIHKEKTLSQVLFEKKSFNNLSITTKFNSLSILKRYIKICYYLEENYDLYDIKKEVDYLFRSFKDDNRFASLGSLGIERFGILEASLNNAKDINEFKEIFLSNKTTQIIMDISGQLILNNFNYNHEIFEDIFSMSYKDYWTFTLNNAHSIIAFYYSKYKEDEGEFEYYLAKYDYNSNKRILDKKITKIDRKIQVQNSTLSICNNKYLIINNCLFDLNTLELLSKDISGSLITYDNKYFVDYNSIGYFDYKSVVIDFYIKSGMSDVDSQKRFEDKLKNK